MSDLLVLEPNSEEAITWELSYSASITSVRNVTSADAKVQSGKFVTTFLTLTVSDDAVTASEHADIDIEDIVTDEELAADDALWDKKFAELQDFLDRLSDKVHSDYLAGLTEDFDPVSSDLL